MISSWSLKNPPSYQLALDFDENPLLLIELSFLAFLLFLVYLTFLHLIISIS
jgi:hypothetical protein